LLAKAGYKVLVN